MPIQTPPAPTVGPDVVTEGAYAAPRVPASVSATPLTTATRLAAELLALFPFVACLDLLIHGTLFQRSFEVLRQIDVDLPLVAIPGLWLAAHPLVAFMFAGIHGLCIWRLMVAGRHRGALVLGGFGAFGSVMFLNGLWLPINNFVRARSW